jgi:ketosteroid isomerase-like protein
MAGNVDLVRRMLTLLERQEFDAMLALLAPEFELDVTDNVFNPAVWKGQEGAASWLEQASEVWLPPTVTVHSLEELGDGRIFAAIDVTQVGRQSGIEVSNPLWQVWTFRDGLVSHCEHFRDEASGRAAAGLNPPS